MNKETRGRKRKHEWSLERIETLLKYGYTTHDICESLTGTKNNLTSLNKFLKEKGYKIKTIRQLKKIEE